MFLIKLNNNMFIDLNCIISVGTLKSMSRRIGSELDEQAL